MVGWLKNQAFLHLPFTCNNFNKFVMIIIHFNLKSFLESFPWFFLRTMAKHPGHRLSLRAVLDFLDPQFLSWRNIYENMKWKVIRKNCLTTVLSLRNTHLKFPFFCIESLNCLSVILLPLSLILNGILSSPNV